MLAAVYYGPQDLRVEQRPIPEIGPQEALLKMVSSGVCGTDLRIYHGAHRKYQPGTIRIPGHEVVGDITQIGADVKGLQVGQRVFIAPNIGCGHCRQCVSGNNNLCSNYDAPGITFDGSFAEYMRIPSGAILQGNIIPIQEDVDPATAALIEPFACVLRGQDKLHIQPGETVLVVGAGPIGVMHVMLAKLRGAGRVLVSELIPERLEQARRLGADRVINPAKEDLPAIVAEETQDQGIDVAIVAAPAPQAQEIVLELAATNGRINYFGGLPKDRPIISINSNLIHYKELLLTGTTACSTDDCRRAASIIASGRIDLSSLVGARFPLKDTVQAILATEAGKSLKVIVEP